MTTHDLVLMARSYNYDGDRAVSLWGTPTDVGHYLVTIDVDHSDPNEPDDNWVTDATIHESVHQPLAIEWFNQTADTWL